MGSFGCPLCCKHDFISVVALHEHLLYYVYRPLQCAICSTHVGGIQELAHHLERHLGDGITSALRQSKLLANQPTESVTNIPPRADYGNSSAIQENPNFYGSNDSRLWKKWGNGADFMSPESSKEPIELTLRAYFCHTCGAKIVGKDAYFLHIKEHISRPNSYVPNDQSPANSSSQLEISSPVWNDVGPSSPHVASVSSTPVHITTDSETVTSEDTRETTVSPKAHLLNCVEESHLANQLLKLREWQLGKHGRRFRKHQLSFSSSRVSNPSPMSEKQLHSISPSTIIDPGSVERPLPDCGSGFESVYKTGESIEASPSLQVPSNSSYITLETTTTEVLNENPVPLTINTPSEEVSGIDENESRCAGTTEAVIPEIVPSANTSLNKEQVNVELPADEEEVPLDDCVVNPFVNDCFIGSPSFHTPQSAVGTSPVSCAAVIVDRADTSMFSSYSLITPHHPVQRFELETVTKSTLESVVNNGSQINSSHFTEQPSHGECVISDTPPTSCIDQVSQKYTEEAQTYTVLLPLDSVSQEGNALKCTNSELSEFVPQEHNDLNYECVDSYNDMAMKRENREIDVYSNTERQRSREEGICPPQSEHAFSDCWNRKTFSVDVDNVEPSGSGYTDACGGADDVSSDVSDKARSSVDSCEGHSDITKPYLHKKFHHDQERKVIATVGIGQNADVSRYIQSFQSLLVSKLNGTLSANLPFKDTNLCSAVDKPKKTTNVNGEDSVIRQSLPNNYVCEVCDVKFTNRPAYKAHYKVHEIKGQKNFKCQYCDKIFFRKRSKDLHLRKHKGEKTHRCELCPKVFTKHYSFQRHQNEVHAVRKSFICAECSKGFSSQRQLEDHISIHQSEKLFKCNDCNHRCQTASGLRTHKMEAHSNIQDKGHQCELCGEHFKQHSGLKRHILRKHSLQKLECDMCPKVYSCNEDLLQHRKIHNSEPLRCDHCEKTFTSSWNLQRHAVTHNSTTHPHKCSKCPLTFTRLDSLSCHMKIHAQKKPHVCHCGKRFVKKSHLKDHEDKHSEVPKHSCNICNKSFKFKVSLKNHSCKVNAEVDRKQHTDTST